MSKHTKLMLLGMCSGLLGWTTLAASVGVFCLAGMALWGPTAWSLVGWSFGVAFTANLLARLLDDTQERLSLMVR